MTKCWRRNSCTCNEEHKPAYLIELLVKLSVILCILPTLSWFWSCFLFFKSQKLPNSFNNYIKYSCCIKVHFFNEQKIFFSDRAKTLPLQVLSNHISIISSGRRGIMRDCGATLYFKAIYANSKYIDVKQCLRQVCFNDILQTIDWILQQFRSVK